MRSRDGAASGVVILTLCVPALIAVVSGCRTTAGPTFADPVEELVWPPRPAETRIRYAGQIHSSADIQARGDWLESIGEFFVGEKEPEALYGPRAVLSLPEAGRIWVADPGGRCLHLFDLQRRRYTKITQINGTPLLTPVGLSRGPEDSIYVCDSERAAVYWISGIAGEFLGEVFTPEVLQRPVSLAYHAASQDLFVVDALAHDIKVVRPNGDIERVIGRRGVGPGEFNYPLAVAVDEEMLWVVDTGNHRVQGLTLAGEPRVVFGKAGDSPGYLALPKDIAVDSHGHLYVVDARFENVQIFDRQGRLLLFFGDEGDGPGQFWLPSGIDVDAHDRIWICDSYNRRLQVFDYVGPATGDRRSPPVSAGPAGDHP